ncbi:MAG: glycosyltransferase family 2 protein [Bacilli bacterium]
MKTLEIINIIIMLLLVVYGLYFLITALFLFKKRKKDNIVSDKYSHFTILIPARNEEEVIKDAIQSFKRQKYPKNNYEIVVVINNTTDNTLGVCNAEGVRCILCERKIKNKGDALKEAFDRLKKEKTDAYIIMDADNVVNDEFLGEMNKSLNEGTLVAKSSMDIKAKENTWVSSSYAIYFFIQSILYSIPRNNIGASCAINGTGIMIKKEVIDKYGFNVRTITEDLEFMTLCALNNIKIKFVERAICYAEHPSDFKVSMIQRRRWTKGIYEGFIIYFNSIIKNIIKRPNIELLDSLLIYSTPLILILSLISIFINFLIVPLPIYLIITSFSLLVSYISISLCALFVCVKSKKKIQDFLTGIIMFPIFLLSWQYLNIIILFKKEVVWDEIKHIETQNI